MVGVSKASSRLEAWIYIIIGIIMAALGAFGAYKGGSGEAFAFAMLGVFVAIVGIAAMPNDDS